MVSGRLEDASLVAAKRVHNCGNSHVWLVHRSTVFSTLTDVVLVCHLHRMRSDLCGLCRDLQVLHLQSSINVSTLDHTAEHQLLHCLRHLAFLRVLSLTRNMRVRKHPVGHDAVLGGSRELAGCSHVPAHDASVHAVPYAISLSWRGTWPSLSTQSCTGPRRRLNRINACIADKARLCQQVSYHVSESSVMYVTGCLAELRLPGQGRGT